MRYCFRCHTAESDHDSQLNTEPHKFAPDHMVDVLINRLDNISAAYSKIAYQLERAENNRISELTIAKKGK